MSTYHPLTYTTRTMAPAYEFETNVARRVATKGWREEKRRTRMYVSPVHNLCRGNEIFFVSLSINNLFLLSSAPDDK